MFYDQKAAYYEFSNFYLKAPIVYKGKKYSTTEHAFQAAKFDDDEYKELIRTAKTPNMARIYGLQKTAGGYAWRTAMNEKIKSYQHIPIKTNWNEIRDGIMQELVDAKFSQHKKLGRLLLKTMNKRIVEDSKDPHWGREGNALGLILENTREKLKNNVL